MKQSINKSQFMDAFRDHNRQDNFSYSALSALYDWLDELSEDTENEYELDVIGLCCEFSELTEEEIKEQYDMSLEEVRDNTQVIDVEPLGFQKEQETTYIIREF